MKMKLIVEMFTKFKQAKKEPLEGLLIKTVKSRLITHSGNKLCFWASPGKGEIVFSDEVPTEKTLNGIWMVSKAIISQVQLKIYEKRYWIIQKHLNWPPSTAELYTSEVHIPPKLGKLLINILSKAKEKPLSGYHEWCNLLVRA